MRALFERLMIEQTERLAWIILSIVFLAGLVIGGSVAWLAAWLVAALVRG